MLGRDLIQPSVARAPDYDSGRDPADAEYGLACAACGSVTVVPFVDVTNRGLAYERELGADTAAAALAHFGVGIVGKSHDGGWLALLRVPCGVCGARYLVYAGVREPSNGRVLVTVQGVAEWISDAPAG